MDSLWRRRKIGTRNEYEFAVSIKPMICDDSRGTGRLGLNGIPPSVLQHDDATRRAFDSLLERESAAPMVLSLTVAERSMPALNENATRVRGSDMRLFSPRAQYIPRLDRGLVSRKSIANRMSLLNRDVVRMELAYDLPKYFSVFFHGLYNKRTYYIFITDL